RGSNAGCCASATPTLPTATRVSTAGKRDKYCGMVMLLSPRRSWARPSTRLPRRTKDRFRGVPSFLTGRLLRNAFFRGSQRQQEVRLVRPPSVSDAEIQGRRTGLPENVVEPSLVGIGPEYGDRAQIPPERPKAPFLGLEVACGNPGVVLHEGPGAVQKEAAQAAEVVGMQQIRGTLDEGVED